MTEANKDALRELHDLMIRTAAMMTNMESLEHRVATVIEGGRQQLSHLVADLNVREMRAELRRISSDMSKIAARLE